MWYLDTQSMIQPFWQIQRNGPYSSVWYTNPILCLAANDLSSHVHVYTNLFLIRHTVTKNLNSTYSSMRRATVTSLLSTMVHRWDLWPENRDLYDTWNPRSETLKVVVETQDPYHKWDQRPKTIIPYQTFHPLSNPWTIM